MYACVRACMHACTYVCVDVCVIMYVCQSVCMYVCQSVCMYVCLPVCLCVCMLLCFYVLCLYVCMLLYMCACMHACMYVWSYTTGLHMFGWWPMHSHYVYIHLDIHHVHKIQVDKNIYLPDPPRHVRMQTARITMGSANGLGKAPNTLGFSYTLASVSTLHQSLNWVPNTCIHVLGQCHSGRVLQSTWHIHAEGSYYQDASNTKPVSETFSLDCNSNQHESTPFPFPESDTWIRSCQCSCKTRKTRGVVCKTGQLLHWLIISFPIKPPI